MNQLKSLLRADFRSMTRDLLMGIIFLVPLFVGLVFRFLVPLASALLWEHTQFDLTPHYDFIVGCAILMAPMLVGTFSGLMLIDDRDENILNYVAVTPLTREGYVRWRLYSPTVMSMVLALAMIWLLDLVTIQLTVVLPVIIVSSLASPLIALFLGALANNKVEGLAYSKATSIINLAALAGYLLETPLRFLAGVIPPFWLPLAFVAGYQGDGVFYIYLGLGLLTHLVLLTVLLKQFKNRIN